MLFPDTDIALLLVGVVPRRVRVAAEHRLRRGGWSCPRSGAARARIAALAITVLAIGLALSLSLGLGAAVVSCCAEGSPQHREHRPGHLVRDAVRFAEEAAERGEQ